MRIALGVAGVDRCNLDGSTRLGAREVLADLERPFELGELAADGGDTHVLDSEADPGMHRINSPGPSGYGSRGVGGAHWFLRLMTEA